MTKRDYKKTHPKLLYYDILKVLTHVVEAIVVGVLLKSGIWTE